MKQPFFSLLVLLHVPRFLTGEPAPAALSAFNSYCTAVESRLAQQHRSPNTFLVPSDLIVEQVNEHLPLSASAEFPGALLHHWRGTAFVTGATAADFERLLRSFDSCPQYFSPQVLLAKALAQQGDRLEASMRVRQRHVITVVLDTNYDITFGQLDSQHRYTISRSTRIAEVGTDEDHGYLWRLNTYWSYQEQNVGLYLQIETVSLTRSIPAGFAWLIRPWVESIPRESLDFTLQSVRKALLQRTKG
jgi:hypothetical protein